MFVSGQRRLTWLGIALSALCFSLALLDMAVAVQARSALLGQAVAMSAIVVSLLYGSSVFLFTRLGAIRRLSAHQPADIAAIKAALVATGAPSVSILIPSYREEPRIVLQTVLSAALADYPNRRITVLLDDPPRDGMLANGTLVRTRALLSQLDAEFAGFAAFLSAERDAFTRQFAAGTADTVRETKRLAALHDRCAEWIDVHGAAFDDGSVSFGHADRLFLREVVGVPAMLLGGFWHGAGWTFLAWGALHGGLLLLNHSWRAVAARLGWPVPGSLGLVGAATTFLAVVAGWVLFRSADLGTALAMFRGMAGQGGAKAGSGIVGAAAALAMAGMLAVVWLAPNTMELSGYSTPVSATRPADRLRSLRPTPRLAVSCGLVLAASLVSLSHVGEFLYFRF